MFLFSWCCFLVVGANGGCVELFVRREAVSSEGGAVSGGLAVCVPRSVLRGCGVGVAVCVSVEWRPRGRLGDGRGRRGVAEGSGCVAAGGMVWREGGSVLSFSLPGEE